MAQRKHKGMSAAGGGHLGLDKVWIQVLMGVVLSIFTALCIPSLIKYIAVVMGVITLAAMIVTRKHLGGKLSLVGVAVALVTAMTGCSVFYSPDRALALPEFSNLFVGCCIFFLILALGGAEPQRKTGLLSIVAVSTATTSLISIDLLSTRVLLDVFLTLVKPVTTAYKGVVGLETGIRMTSLYTDANVFAGIVGLGVLLSLALALTAEERDQRILSRTCLFLNALGFVLAFSMGATAAIVVAFLLMLLLEEKSRRSTMVVLMMETFVITLMATIPIFATSFEAWSGVQLVPIACALLGSGLLCIVDQKVGRPMAQWLGQHQRAASLSIVGVVAVLMVFGLVAYNWAGSIVLSQGETLRRSAYPAGGEYQLVVDSDDSITVTVESQNQEDTLNHESTILYRGSASDASFQVPEDSLVIYVNFYAPDGAEIETATLVSDQDEIALKLGYKLLPGFIANRLQGLWANENAIQRTAFFVDGLKIFKTSPLIGRGSGAFESLLREVQEYSYGTRYVHNHYIQVMLETGLVGLVLFLGLLATALVALWRKRKSQEASTVIVALLGVMAFIIIHMTVEVVFSMGTYLVVAMSTFGLIVLFAGDCMPIPDVGKKVQLNQVIPVAAGILVSAWVVLIGLNCYMPTMVQNSSSAKFLSNLKLAYTLDRFDGDDFRYACISIATNTGAEEMVEQATLYAEDLSSYETDPNNIAYLIRFYFSVGELAPISSLLDGFMKYNPDDIDGWEMGFNLLWSASEELQSQAEFADIVADFYSDFVAYNETNGVALALDEDTLEEISLFVEAI